MYSTDGIERNVLCTQERNLKKIVKTNKKAAIKSVGKIIVKLDISIC